MTITRRHARWMVPLLAAFLPAHVGCGWSGPLTPQPAGPTVARVAVPANRADPAPLTALVMLHAMGSHPDDFLGDQRQDFADRLGVAVVAVNGPVQESPTEFAWSDDPAANLARVREGLGELKKKAAIRQDRVILLGYSQGAYVALGLAYTYPEEFAGAVAVSPGSMTDRPLPPAAQARLRGRGFVLAYGEKDQPAWVRQGRERVEAAGRAGARTEVRVYPGAGHMIPPDLDERLPEWVAFVEKAAEQVATPP